MLDTLRKLVEASLGVLTSDRAQELARGLAREGQARAEQAARVAQELMDWSKENRERLLEVVQREVKKQISALGVVTREQVDSLRGQIERVEVEDGGARPTRAGPGRGTRTGQPSRKSARGRPSGKPGGARTAASGKPSATKTSAKRTSSTKSGGRKSAATKSAATKAGTTKAGTRKSATKKSAARAGGSSGTSSRKTGSRKSPAGGPSRSAGGGSSSS